MAEKKPSKISAVIARRREAHRRREAELEAENIALRAALEMAPSDEDTWGSSAPQELRDQMAASALFAEKLDEFNALRRLGFDPGPRNANEPTFKPAKALARRIFGTPGVRAILERDLADEPANRRMVVSNLLQVAEHGSDAEKVRAAQVLAKYNDWNEGDKSVAKAGANNFNLMQMLGAPSQNGSAKIIQHDDHDAIIDAEEFLVHEPSAEGERVIDEDAVALQQ